MGVNQALEERMFKGRRLELRVFMAYLHAYLPTYPHTYTNFIIIKILHNVIKYFIVEVVKLNTMKLSFH